MDIKDGQYVDVTAELMNKAAEWTHSLLEEIE